MHPLLEKKKNTDMSDIQQNNRKRLPLTQQQAFAMNNNRIPPQVVDIEESVLGAIMIDEDALINTIDRLRPEHFYKERTKRYLMQFFP